MPEILEPCAFPPCERLTAAAVRLVVEGEDLVLPVPEGTVVVARGVANQLKIDEVNWEALDTAKGLYIANFGSESPDFLEKLVGEARRRNPGIVIAFNPGQGQLRQGLETLRPVLAQLDVLNLNVEEAQQLIAEDSTVCVEDADVPVETLTADVAVPRDDYDRYRDLPLVELLLQQAVGGAPALEVVERAAHRLDQAARQREAEPRALDAALLGAESLERREQPLVLVGRNARPGILHRDADARRVRRRGDAGNAHDGIRRAVFHRVREQVEQHLREPLSVRAHEEVGVHIRTLEPEPTVLGDRTDGERFSGAGARDDAESLPRSRQLTHARAVLLFEERLDVQTQCELDGLAGSARRRDDDDASGARLGGDECVTIRREPRLVNLAMRSHAGRRCKDGA